MDKMVENNLKGIDLEKQGDVNGAIALYEENVAARFIGNHPYDRLVIIYKRLKKIDDAKRVLNIAIDVFENDVVITRADRIPKLNKFKEKLSKLK
ncbi:hypothetical protein ACFQOY_13860 [Enterococcus alcedinis]|uniref:Tetratricopeptide repeat protein n=1 Tax=Enterococcus alcedinis TaxID=1274384 RepID=A0A917JEN0_9ENTE|nr:hypothetical protein [Enterococcus alcedinis]MBP2100995.1 tetratricopeptide (TPR) repeat protein [Enterococcus alcedinis]GGI64707.1 hypothetical protein GCM10011482_03610 [Enterococcus alcedinis]